MAERGRSGPTGSPLVLTLLIVALLVTAAVACSGGGSDGDGNGSDRDGGGGGDPGEHVAAVLMTVTQFDPKGIQERGDS